MRKMLLAIAISVLTCVGASRTAAGPDDRQMLDACLKMAAANGAAQREADAKRTPEEVDANPGAAEQIRRAVEQAAGDPLSCIGIIAAPCMSQPEGQTTIGMQECISREYELWDERLNTAYAAARKALQPAQAAKLRDLQRAWIAARDAKCNWAYVEYEGGTITGPISAECQLEETARQAIWLESRQN